MCFAQDNSAERAAQQSREIEAVRQARVQEGMGQIDQTFGQFDDNYYKQVQDSFLKLMQPDLTKQYQDAKRGMVLNLARTGKIGSSSGIRNLGELEETRKRSEADLANRALNEGQKARADVETSRGDLINLLNATGDPGAAAQAANTRASLLSAPRQFEPLANAFQALTSAAATGAVAEQNGYRGFNSGLFDVKPSARTVN